MGYALTTMLESDTRAQYQEGLERLGQVLGYQASRPRHQGAMDCLWYSAFGNSREVVTFKAKIEHAEAGQVDLHAVGQAHTQQSWAEAQYPGYTVRSAIVTHLTKIEPSALAALGPIRLVEKNAILTLWTVVKTLLSLYREKWSLNDIDARLAAAQPILSPIPPTGWLIRAFPAQGRFLTRGELCKEWGEGPPTA
jgi:hypothetical protein